MAIVPGHGMIHPRAALPPRLEQFDFIRQYRSLLKTCENNPETLGLQEKEQQADQSTPRPSCQSGVTQWEGIA
jgi:hypothetical protein